MKCPDCNAKMDENEFEIKVYDEDVTIESRCPSCKREDKYHVPAYFYFGIADKVNGRWVYVLDKESQ